MKNYEYDILKIECLFSNKKIFKSFVCVFLSVVLLFDSTVLCFADSGSSGRGEDQNIYERLWGYISDNVSKAAQGVLNFTYDASQSTLNYLEDMFDRMTPDEVNAIKIQTIQNSPLDEFIDKEDVTDEEIERKLQEDDTYTLTPELLNGIQSYISDMYAYDTGMYHVYTRQSTTQPDSWNPTMPLVHSMFFDSLIEEHEVIFIQNSNIWTEPYVCWLKGDIDDYYFYIYDTLGSGENEKSSIYVARKDGGVVHYARRRIINPTFPNAADQFQFYLKNFDIEQVQGYNNFCIGYATKYNSLSGVINNGLANTMITGNGVLSVYASADEGAARSLFDTGIIPTFIQSEDDIYDSDEEITVDLSNLAEFDYNHICSLLQIGPKNTSREIQLKINQVMKDLNTQLETGQKIDEEAYKKIENLSDDGNNLLTRILYSVRELNLKFDALLVENSAFYAALLALIEEIQLKLDALLATEVTDIVDVGEDIFGDVGIGALLEEINLKLDGILSELGFLVADEIAEDTAELIGDSIDFGSTIGTELTKKFPLSIPWDIALIIDCLSSPPATPVFELPLSIPSYGIDETITVDLSDFQLLSDVARWFFDVLFGLAITKLTMKILEIDLVHD